MGVQAPHHPDALDALSTLGFRAAVTLAVSYLACSE
jgi:hypothetical protein